MEPVDVGLLARELDALASELEEERWRHVAGIEPRPSLAPLFRARSRAAHRDAVAGLRAEGDEPLARAVAALRAERAAAEDEEAWRAAEAAATGLGPDGAVSIPAASLALRAEHSAELRAAVAGLDEPYRETIALRFFAERSLAEIAAETGRPLGTVKTHLHRGLLRLREVVGEPGIGR
jgi:RNA polymerase sigma factor (sigma-70 family)